MKLYSGRIAAISEDIIRTLRNSEAIEVSADLLPEAELDVQGVLREYLRTDRGIGQQARELSEAGRGSYSRIKRQLTQRANFKTGDEAIEYIIDQLIEVFLHSSHIEEVYVDDLDLRRQMTVIIKKHTRDVDAQLDETVRQRIKNLEEGSVSWDVEYERTMKRLKREKKLD